MNFTWNALSYLTFVLCSRLIVHTIHLLTAFLMESQIQTQLLLQRHVGNVRHPWLSRWVIWFDTGSKGFSQFICR
uniref:Uncharacterized protein n=1 Tax=Leersia perrieri TaxID=77586 RepID=A0A0D9VGH3_9ORYZ